MPSGNLRDELIRKKLRSANDEYEIQCVKCNDINELQDCHSISWGIGYCCPACDGPMKCISIIPSK